MYDERDADDRYQIGSRHVRIGLDQKYVISAMGVVSSFLLERLFDEFPAREERLAYSQALSKMLDLDLELNVRFVLPRDHVAFADLEPGTGAGQRAAG